MKHPTGRIALTLALALTAVVLTADRRAAAQTGPTPEQRVAALKQSIQQSQANLRKYEWIETTVISLKGEEKSRKQQRCYYGAEGKVTKEPMGEAAPAQAAGGRRGGGRLKQRVVENKKEELQDYMEKAVSLVHQYVPPKPEDIEKAKTAGKIAVRPGESGRVRLQFTDYLKPGDQLGIDVDAAASRLLGLNVASYLDAPDDAVTLTVQQATLADGTSYTSQTTLDAKAKQVTVVIQNSGYRPRP